MPPPPFFLLQNGTADSKFRIPSGWFGGAESIQVEIARPVDREFLHAFAAGECILLPGSAEEDQCQTFRGAIV